MPYSQLILPSLLLILVLFKAIRLLYFVQLKEYRYDRLKDFIQYDNGMLEIFTIPDILAYLAFLANITFYPNEVLLKTAIGLACLNFFYSKVRFKPTKKALLIFTSFSLVQLVLFFLQQTILGYITLIPLMAIIVGIVNLISLQAKNKIIARAKAKMKNFPDLKIIAITGSYGKSSTKEFLATILSTKFKVFKTPKNINTDIGIAQLILAEDLSQYDIFVVELGAYRIGEINKAVQMLQVDFAVITAIIEQHLSLFGTLENIRKAKSEVTNTLKKQGKLYLNYDTPENKLVAEKIKEDLRKIEVIPYGETHIKAIKQDEDQLSFTIQKETYLAPIYGKHNAINLSVCIKIAKELGFSTDEIHRAFKKLENPELNLRKIVGKNGATIFDDSYNSNLNGFLAAMDLVNSSLKPTKILITLGVLELGEKTEEVHRKIAQKADSIFDHIYVTKPRLATYFSDLKQATLHTTNDPDRLIAELQKLITSDTVILVENRLSPKVKKFLLS